MLIQDNKVVGLSFDLHIDHEEDGKVLVEKATIEAPCVFIYGLSGLPEKFDEFLLNKKVGDSFDFTVASDDAYGEYDEGGIIDLPKNAFDSEPEVLVEGNRIPLTDAQGDTVVATILEIEEDVVVVDLNHPLAGYDLHFTGTVNEIREATIEEIAHGHVHGEGGHHHDH